MQNELLDMLGDDTQAGFRLDYLEVYNWGTFNQKVWHIKPGSHNALLTGDIGSGKSTLVDAITTLLVPHNRIIYNRAAGAEGKERTLYSYIRGEYKNEQDESSQRAKAVALRDENSYSVILANFYNHGLLQNITLAQVFWLKDGKRNPERFFIIAQTSLNIAKHFSNFGDNILKLKKNLGNLAHVLVLDSFKDYSNKFRQLFGIQNEQALDLFYQTISMKSIGNLTEFVRSHMLEKSDISNSLQEIESNFENLNQSYLAIIKVKDQIKLLQPLSVLSAEYQGINNLIEELNSCNNILDGYFAGHTLRLCEIQLHKLEQDIIVNANKCRQIAEKVNQFREEEGKLLFGIEEHGGQRIRELEQEISQLNKERERRHQFAERYQKLITKLELQYKHDEAGFYLNVHQIRTILQDTEQQLQELSGQSTTLRIEMKVVGDKIEGIEGELNSLRQRSSNIPAKILKIREDMVRTLELEEEDLPFIGELIQVNPQAKQWEGAIERVLHNFGLSLLVTDAHYNLVAKYVERTDLHGKLVYYRVKAEKFDLKEYTEDSLSSKLLIKADSNFYTWINYQIQSRFNYTCCENLEDFRRYPLAITKMGQIKSSGSRHEKDDRYALNDISRYILGWDNKDKIKVLQSQHKGLEQQISEFSQQLIRLNKTHTQLNNRRDVCRDLALFDDFNLIFWQDLVKQIDVKQAQKAEIESSSDILHKLRGQLADIRREIDAESERFNIANKYEGELKGRISSITESMEAARECLAGITEQYFPLLDKISADILKGSVLNNRNITATQNEVRKYLNAELSKNNRLKGVLNTKITSIMQVYKTSYPLETMEVDVSLEAIPEYILMLAHFEADDLPRHELRFKELLNEGTINSIALLQNQLKKEESGIRNKISIINKSLYDIEYNSGTYIALLADTAYDTDIRGFREQLRNCLSNTIEGSVQQTYYSEEKFKQIKLLIDRFRGRPESVEADRRWTQKVTDVRNWFNFSASERFIEDNVEKEFYSDSAGKSGGQKEKLAYTVLASALVYQFGLEHGAKNTRSFRFVVIDEAFGRGSDESTRYGLELFKRLHLQLLIITPLQKIRIIEEYINAVHFVHNTGGKCSEVHNLTVAEYKEQQPDAE